MADFSFEPFLNPGEAAVNAGPMVNAGQGWCMICNREVGEDIEAHFNEAHTAAATTKPRTTIMSWQDRTKHAIETLNEVLAGTDPQEQVNQVDEVILDLYDIRARLAGKTREP